MRWRKNEGQVLQSRILPNKSVKETRRPLAVLKFSFYQGWAASLKLNERRAPYRHVMRRRVR
jgi:hypothetical protein